MTSKKDGAHEPATPAVTLNIGQVSGGLVAGVVTGPVQVGSSPVQVRSSPAPDPASASPKAGTAPTPAPTPAPVAPERPSKGRPVGVVYLSAPADAAHRAALGQHLRPSLDRLGLADWHLDSAPPGTDVAAALQTALRSARAVLLLVTPAYLVDDRCRAAERAAMACIQSGMRIVPVSVRTVADWKNEPFGHLARLPSATGGRAVAEWSSKDEAWADVARGVAAVLDSK